MLNTRPRLKTPISYYGGKQQMLAHILPNIPSHRIYTEAFVGGGAVFWAKEPAQSEIINDVNGEVSNFYRILRTEFDALKEAIAATLHSREAYYDALHIYKRPHLHDALLRAWAFYVLTMQGFSCKIGSWGYAKDNTVAKKLINACERWSPDLVARLRITQIECTDALAIISSRDAPDAFHYIDPPYFNSNCGHYTGYGEADFSNLLTLLASIKGKFLLSSYPSDVLAIYTAANGWYQKEVIKTLNVDARRLEPKKKREVLTANFPLV